MRMWTKCVTCTFRHSKKDAVVDFKKRFPGNCILRFYEVWTTDLMKPISRYNYVMSNGEKIGESNNETPKRKGWWRESLKALSAEWPPKDPAPRDIGAVRDSLKKKTPPSTRYTYPVAQKLAPPVPRESVSDEPDDRPAMRGRYERERGLESLRKEAEKDHDRIFSAHGERVRRMRSSPERRAEKAGQTDALQTGEVPPAMPERVRRINILLRAGAYDRNRFQKLPETDRKSVV